VTDFARWQPLLRGGPMADVAASHAGTVAEAQEWLTRAVRKFTQDVRSMSAEELDRPVETPVGTLTGQRIAALAVIDLLHHHGQIAYIQTLLGDTETHLDLSTL
jgi:hypothetical protein